jgi:hypothetical protein
MAGDTLVALGAESAEEWRKYIQRAATATRLDITAKGDGYGPSDQTSFYAKQIPVLHLFTGTHEDYHSPTDDAEKINAMGGAAVTRFTATLATALAVEANTPVYARASAAPAMSGDSRGYGAYLGTVPDFRAMESTEGGVLLSDVRPGGPAEVAGIRGGDRVLQIAGTTIANLYDMTYALQDHKPGETVEVVVLRDEKKVKLLAILGDRAAMGRPGAAAAAAAPASPAGTPADPHAAAPSMPPSGDPHAATGGGADPAADAHGGRDEPGISPEDSGLWLPDPFFEGRPGPEWKPGAGTPFAPRLMGESHLADIRQLRSRGRDGHRYIGAGNRRLASLSPPGCGIAESGGRPATVRAWGGSR